MISLINRILSRLGWHLVLVVILLREMRRREVAFKDNEDFRRRTAFIFSDRLL